MPDRDEWCAGVPVVHLLLWTAPARSGRFVVGGWSLEQWQGRDCAWAMELAGLGAYFWVDARLAKVVATRVLSVHRLSQTEWLPCGRDQPVYRAHPAGDARAVRSTVTAPARAATALLDAPVGGRSPSRTGTAVT